ncbi:MAG TPA: quinol:electron acceptor oxidoreductase subunit ActD [Anaerolineaceae bacterium]|nr:quinol:electron acceptor oxidoreductase subunit ActD [Anaerolineaceae bacterium]
MAYKAVTMVLFKEEEVDLAAQAVERLHELGVTDRNISVISSVPYSDKILGRPMNWTSVPRMAIGGAVVGCLAAIFLTYITPLLYPLTVGGQPLQALPPAIVLIFELTMLGLLIATFLGVVLEMISPSYGPTGYHPKISDGYIGVLYHCPPEHCEQIRAELADLGAEILDRMEVKSV